MPPLAAPPPLSDDASLFLDFDGTLVPLADTPDGIVVDSALTDLLSAVATRLDHRVVLVSGRSIAQLDHHVGATAVSLAIAGSHGAEQRLAGAEIEAVAAPAGLAHAAEAFAAQFGATTGVVIERKSHGVGLHYRLAPEHEAAAKALADTQAQAHDLVVQHGKMMVELRAPGDKGTAIARLMRQAPFAGHTPIFLGDDVTDEDGFETVASLGGAGILIGPPRATAARYRLDDTDAVRSWLSRIA